MSQYALGLTLPPVYSEGNFFTSDCNREAFARVRQWPAWPSPALLLVGPDGSGKTHLGHIWASRAGAGIIAAADLAGQEPRAGHCLIEDIERLTQERALFHWFNATREAGCSLLMTSSLPVRQLPFTLPDLTSRLLAAPLARIEQPDDEVLAAAMRKQFSDRQVKVDEEVIAYIVSRMERSLAAAKELVDVLDARALAEGKTITIPFFKKVVETR